MVSKIKNKMKVLGGRFFRKYFPSYPYLKNIAIILLYHRVLEKTPEGLYDPGLFVTAGTFEMHLREISKYFDVVALEKLTQSNSGEGRFCTITFDDGWIDNYEIAFPILKKYRMPATMFLPTGKIGMNDSFWFDNLWELANHAVRRGAEAVFIEKFHKLVRSWYPRVLSVDHLSNLTLALKYLPASTLDDLVKEAFLGLNIHPLVQKNIIDWDHVSEMSQYGITFGSHGLQHYILPTLDNGLKRKDIFESLEGLKSRGARTIPFFSFPNGEWDRESLQLICDAKYRGALTTRIGFNVPGTNPFLLNRISLHEYISNIPELLWFRIFQAMISGSGRGKESDKR